MKEFDLSGLGITDFTDIFQSLATLTELEQLNLSNNPISKLPDNTKDLSPNITHLDLGEINFSDFDDTIEKLIELPQLQVLTMHLTE